MVLVEVSAVSNSYPRRMSLRTELHPVVENVSLRIEAGETVGLAGESGSGKTALARTILDEPVSAIDVSVGAQIINLLRRLLNQQALTCLFISPSVPPVRCQSTRIAVVQRGRLVETGKPEALCENPREAYSRQLLEATPALPPALARGHIRPACPPAARCAAQDAR